MDYAETITIHKTKFTKQELLNYYNDFTSILNLVNIGQIYSSISIRKSTKDFEFHNIDEFKNEIHSDDKINNLMLICYIHVRDLDCKYAINLSTCIYTSLITFRSTNKSWADEEAYKYKKQLKSRNTTPLKKLKNSWNKSDIIALIATMVTIIIAILGWTIFKN